MQLCLNRSKELVKKCTKETFYQNYIGFGINIAGKYLEIHGLIKEKGIKYHLLIIKAKIPLSKESVEKVEEFVHVLLILRVSIFLISKYMLSYIVILIQKSLIPEWGYCKFTEYYK